VETVVFHVPCHRDAPPGPLGEVIPPGTNGQFDPEKGLVLLASWVEGLVCTTEPHKVQEPARGAPPIKTGKNSGSNSGLPLEAEEESDQLPATPVTAFWSKTVSLRFREQSGSTVLCESA
jgi:hypothetical protein